MLLETLTPVERAVFLLHQVFEYSHPETAQALGLSHAAVRQIFHRAREHVSAKRPRFAPTEEDHGRILGAFAAAVAQGDLSGILQLLADDAMFWADSGGKVRGAALKPLEGAESVARFFQGLLAKYMTPDQVFEVRCVNGWPALVGSAGGRVNAVIAIETDGERIVSVRNIVNPDKLRLIEVS